MSSRLDELKTEEPSTANGSAFSVEGADAAVLIEVAAKYANDLIKRTCRLKCPTTLEERLVRLAERWEDEGLGHLAEELRALLEGEPS